MPAVSFIIFFRLKLIELPTSGSIQTFRVFSRKIMTVPVEIGLQSLCEITHSVLPEGSKIVLTPFEITKLIRMACFRIKGCKNPFMKQDNKIKTSGSLRTIHLKLMASYAITMRRTCLKTKACCSISPPLWTRSSTNETHSLVS